jgi:hypothetical protein
MLSRQVGSYGDTIQNSASIQYCVPRVHLGTVAQWERETTVERAVAALDCRRSRGEWRGRIPFGFQVGEDGKLAEDPDAMTTIAAIKRSRRRSGTSYPKLVKQYGLAVGTVYKIVQTDLRTIPARGCARSRRKTMKHGLPLFAPTGLAVLL